jgi:hypothetical protein
MAHCCFSDKCTSPGTRFFSTDDGGKHEAQWSLCEEHMKLFLEHVGKHFLENEILESDFMILSVMNS